ncbi:MAG: hypothetical protein ACYDBU_09335 [Vulcanimicrobiaceae bacterium]
MFDRGLIGLRQETSNDELGARLPRKRAAARDGFCLERQMGGAVSHAQFKGVPDVRDRILVRVQKRGSRNVPCAFTTYARLLRYLKSRKAFPG